MRINVVVKGGQGRVEKHNIIISIPASTQVRDDQYCQVYNFMNGILKLFKRVVNFCVLYKKRHTI